ncbi:MAG: membrane integrity-associated transporter subunit PqiC [Gammaproteobacteria bacterium]|nr:membrane integrity-associated transporter subunit PqiC [Gammaproteobacteria bacterium]
MMDRLRCASRKRHPFQGLRRFGLVVVSSLLLTACSVLPQNELAQSMRTYTIEPELPQPGGARPLSAVIHVAPISPASTLQSNRMLYVPRRFELSAFVTSEWASEPAQLLDAWLVRALEQSGHFTKVISGPSSRSADLRLDVELLVLRQEFLQVPSSIHMVLRAVLTDLRAGQVLASRELAYVQPAPSEDAYGGVQAANQAVGKALSDLVRFSAAAGGS